MCWTADCHVAFYTVTCWALWVPWRLNVPLSWNQCLYGWKDYCFSLAVMEGRWLLLLAAKSSAADVLAKMPANENLVLIDSIPFLLFPGSSYNSLENCAYPLSWPNLFSATTGKGLDPPPASWVRKGLWACPESCDWSAFHWFLLGCLFFTWCSLLGVWGTV